MKNAARKFAPEPLVKNYMVTDSVNDCVVYTTTDETDAARQLKKLQHLEGDYFYIATCWLNPMH